MEQYFNKIFVIESLFPEERPTGKELSDNLLNLKSSEIEFLTTAYVHIKSRGELLQLLEELSTEVKRDDTLPILHFEIHGNEDGLVLANQDFLPWVELKAPLTKINVATRLNLLLTLAVCQGAYLTSILKPTEKAPLLALVGPTEKEFGGDLSIGFFAFYDELLTSFDGDKAIRRLVAALNYQVKYSFISCEWMFKNAYKKHVAEAFHPDEIERRVERMLVKVKKEKKLRGRSRADLSKYFKDQLLSDENKRYYFEKFKSAYFMYDLYPEHQQRFNVPYEEISIGL